MVRFNDFKQQFSVDRIIIVFDGFCNGQIVYMIVTNLMIYDALAVEFRHCRLAVAVDDHSDELHIIAKSVFFFPHIKNIFGRES